MSTHFICFQAWNMILAKLSSFSIAECLINVNISYRFLSLLVITGVFVFIVLKGNICFCQFCPHHLSVAAIRLYFMLPRYCIFFSGLFLVWSYKKSELEILLPEHFCLRFDERFSHCHLPVYLNLPCHGSALSSPLHLLSRSIFPKQ